MFPTSPDAVVAALLSAQLTAVIGTPSTATLSRRVLELLSQLPEGVRVVAAPEGLIDWVAAVDVLSEGWGKQRVESMKSKELLLSLQPAGVLLLLLSSVVVVVSLSVVAECCCC